VSGHDPNRQQGERPSPLARALNARKPRRPPPRALVGSIILHLLLVATVVSSTQIQTPEDPTLRFKTFRVELYSPPPQVEGPPDPIPETPKPAIIKKPPPPEPKPEVKPKPVVAKPKPTPTPKVDETAKRTAQTTKKPVSGRNAKPGPVGGEGLNVLQEGEEFPYPEYLGNVIRQVHRYFRWDGSGNLEGEVGFYIRRDGTITGLRVVKRSGEYRFDIAAADAVNNASRARAFGPLPNGFESDSLGILFSFRPGR
jgi:protein TonB